MDSIDKIFSYHLTFKKSLKLVTGLIAGYSLWFCMLILFLKWFNPPFTAFTMQETWGDHPFDYYSLRDNWVPADEIPEHVKLAVIASEDQRFNQHWGIDAKAIKKAINENQQGGRIRGASTITQQVAKNLFLTPAQSYLRKGIEAGIAVVIDLFWSKERILEVYLNIAEFGPGMYGIATATDFYYQISPSELSPEQAARMATVLPSPRRIEPEPASAYVIKRSKWILRNMQQLSGRQYLPDTYEDALKLDSGIFDPSRLIGRVRLKDTLKLSHN
ncbi:monofunctional biosynthetic peptidoglycan transglycosylase [Balneola sp. MJW-20]|uniref:monofunctional biosynthetic peptidoglycan transglycosylase n=1 Tax=Gracilimonas aurantiaca TaxID=3234185 RepID=UPI0034667E1D